MKSTAGWGLPSAEASPMFRRVVYLALLLTLLLQSVLSLPCVAQEVGEASDRISPPADPRFRTPQETVARWVKAVNGRHWGDEYECYAGDQQARFTLQLLISTDEVRGSDELFDELRRVFNHHRFPTLLLDDYPSLRRDFSQIRDEAEVQRMIAEQLDKRRSQVERWKRDIQALPIDWARLLDDLQPILVKSYASNSGGLHPSSTGIVYHLDYHRFIRESIDEIDGALAYGTVVPVIRDAKSMIDDDPVGREFDGLKSVLDDHRWLSLLRKRRGERLPERIRLVKVDEGWKLDFVPYR